MHATLRAKLAAAEAAEDFDACEAIVAEAAATPRTLLESVRMAEQAERDQVRANIFVVGGSRDDYSFLARL